MLRTFARMAIVQSPVFLFGLLTASIFVEEVFVMLLLGTLPTMFGWPVALVDGTLLVVLLFPVLHYSAFRPLLQALRAREQAEQSLQKANDELETRVEERTAELQKANDVLRVEMAERQRVEQERERLIGQLQQALAEVKQLSGLLPICSGCKKSGMAGVIGTGSNCISPPVPKPSSRTASARIASKSIIPAWRPDAMTPLSSQQRLAACQSFSKGASVFAILIGGLVLAGWALDVAFLKSAFPGLVTMKANTALAFILTGAALWWLQEGPRQISDLRFAISDLRFEMGKPRRRLGQICAGLVLLVGVLTLSEYLLGWDLGIDQVLFRAPAEATATNPPGRMAVATALNFSLLGVALLLLDAEAGPGHRPAQ